MMDPHTAAELSLDQIRLVDDLIEAHGGWIPPLRLHTTSGMTYVAAAGPLRRDALPPLRPQRPAAAAVSLGLWHNFGDDQPARRAARDPAPRVRPRHHPLRPRQQLRAAVRLGRGELRPHLRRTSRPTATSCHLHEGRLRHVARPVRRVGLAQVPARVPRPEPQRMGLDYVDIFYSHRLRPGHAARGDDRRARHRRPPGQGAVRRDLVLLGRAHARGRRGSCASSARRC